MRLVAYLRVKHTSALVRHVINFILLFYLTRFYVGYRVLQCNREYVKERSIPLSLLRVLCMFEFDLSLFNIYHDS